MREALIVFARRLEPGTTKTRLSPALEPDQAMHLYRAMAEDTALMLRSTGRAIRWYLTGEGALPVEPIETETMHEQRGDGLGARMTLAIAETVAAGFERAVVVGTDSPTLPAAFIEEGFAAIRAPRSVVLGPAEDGGYYLIGLSLLLPAIFDVEYSSPDTLSQTIDRARDLDLSVTLLPEWFDVDTPADLGRLAALLEESAEAAPATAAELRRLEPSA